MSKSLLEKTRKTMAEGKYEVDNAVRIDVDRAKKLALRQVHDSAVKGFDYTWFEIDDEVTFPFAFQTLRHLAKWFRDEGFEAKGPISNRVGTGISIRIMW